MITAWPLCILPGALADAHYAAQNGQTPAGTYTAWDSAASNIQDAVNAAIANDTVWVGAGRYTVPTNPVAYFGTNVVYINKLITLRSSNGVPASTIIDGGGANRGVAMVYLATSGNRFTLDGFTISNCYGTNSGGGVLLFSDDYAWHATIQNCIISNNTVAYGTHMGTPGRGDSTGSRGGGISFWNSYYVSFLAGLIVSNCVITGNRVLDGGSGGGIFVQNGGQRLIIDCLIENNLAGYGGGVATGYTPISPSAFRNGIENCVIKGNRALNNGGGWQGGQFSPGNETNKFKNCLFYNNVAAGVGGGLRDEQAGKVELVNCTIVSNRATTSGSGISVYNANWQVCNSIVYYNWTDNLNMATYANSYFTNTCVTPITSLLGSGNFTTAPDFVNNAGQDFRLSANSPCVNRGLNQAWMTNAVDLDKRARIRYGTVDVGAYEVLYRGAVFKFR